MTYKRKARQSYRPLRHRKARLKTATLKSKVASSPSSRNVFKTREFQANITDIALFLAKFLSGKNEVAITPTEYYGGFACKIEQKGSRTYYDIIVLRWDIYKLPLDPKSKYRIYRSSIWHEAMHTRYTPEKVYSIGASGTGDNAVVADELKHDIANILEDRRIEDLGTKMWPGYKSERLFSNGYFWSQRMDVGEFWKTYLDRYYDPNTGKFDLSNFKDKRKMEEYLKRRLSHMRHEAILQRIITGKIKGAQDLPLKERQLIEDVAAEVEDELKKITKEKISERKVYRTLKELTEKVIRDLQLQHYKPPIRILGESSWDTTFTPEWAESKGEDDRRKVRAGIDDYFDEIVKVEYICTHCGKPYTKIYGHRHKPGGSSTPPPPGVGGM